MSWKIWRRPSEEDKNALSGLIRMNSDAVTPGFPLKVESLEPTMKFRTFFTMKYIGKGRRPKYRAWVEWIRVRVFRMKPRFTPYTWADIAPPMKTCPTCKAGNLTIRPTCWECGSEFAQ